MRPSEKSLCHWGHALKEDCEIPALFTLLWHGHKVNSFVPDLSLDQHKEILQLWDLQTKLPSSQVNYFKCGIKVMGALTITHKGQVVAQIGVSILLKKN